MAVSGPVNISIKDVLERTDEKIKEYVQFIFNTNRAKIAVFETLLNKQIVNANQILSVGEKWVTNGITGSPAPQKEAARRLHAWASGAMQKEIEDLGRDLEAFCLRSEQPKPETAEKPAEPQKANQPNQVFDMMKDMGLRYRGAEASKRKAELALAELNRLKSVEADSVSKAGSAKGETPHRQMGR